jgi:hypothetical protein
MSLLRVGGVLGGDPGSRQAVPGVVAADHPINVSGTADDPLTIRER